MEEAEIVSKELVLLAIITAIGTFYHTRSYNLNACLSIVY